MRAAPWRRLRAGAGALHLPPRTVRLRLTLLYGGLFLLAGVGLLAITYLLLNRSPGDYLYSQVRLGGGSSRVVIASNGGAAAGPADRAFAFAALHPPGALSGLGAPQSALRQLHQLQLDAEHQHALDLHHLLEDSGIALALMALLAVGLGWVVAGRVLSPLRTMRLATQQISEHNLHERLALQGPDDELKGLGDTIDGLLARLEAAFSAQRRFVANASHELRTPLTYERAVLEVALADPAASRASLRAACEELLACGEQQERLIEALLTLASSERGLERAQPLDLAGVARGVLAGAAAAAEEARVRLVWALAPAPCSGSPELLERLVANLVDNAVRYNRRGGLVEVLVAVRGSEAVLAVENTGPAVPEAELGRLFQPFQRLQGERGCEREGHGLGLSIVAAIARAHGGTLGARARPGGGLRVELVLPAGRAGDMPALLPFAPAGSPGVQRPPARPVSGAGHLGSAHARHDRERPRAGEELRCAVHPAARRPATDPDHVGGRHRRAAADQHRGAPTEVQERGA